MDVAAFSPTGMEPWEWDRIEGFVRQAVTTAQKHYSARYQTRDMMSTVAALTWWTTEVACYPMETSVVFHRDTIEDYVQTGCGTMTPGSRATRRSMLLRVAEAVLTPAERVARLQPLHADNPARPYSEFEQRRLRSWAEGQTTPTRRMECRALLSLGLGAGLASGDIICLYARDVVVDDLGVLIRVPGERGRDVPVLAAWEQEIVDLLAVRDPDGRLLGTRRVNGGKNWLNNVIATSAPEGTLRPVVTGMRNTWLLHHMTVGTPIGPLVCAAGLQTFRTIEKLLPLLPEPSQDEVRRSMRRALRAV